MTADNVAKLARAQHPVTADASKIVAANYAVRFLATIDLEQEKNTSFDGLIQSLRDALGPSSGLDWQDVDVDKIINLMEDYASNEKEWKKYSMGDESMAYTRNLVDTANEKSNLLILVWSPGKSSPIHDHANSHCLMKILKGNLTETRFEWPKEGADGQEMQVKAEQTLGENQVAYMNDKLGLHRMSNPDSDFAVSLHLYAPPWAARRGCHIFDKRSSQKTHVPCGYYSKYGQRVHE